MHFRELHRMVEDLVRPQQRRVAFRAVCVSPASAPREAARALYEELVVARPRALALLTCRPGGNATLERDGREAAEVPEAGAAALEWVAGLGGAPGAFLIDVFEALELERQIALLSDLRGAREQGAAGARRDQVPLVVVVLGAWRSAALRSEWRRRSNAGALGSHVFDSTWILGGLDRDSIAERLQDVRLTLPERKELARFLEEHTAGDPVLVEHAVEALHGLPGDDAASLVLALAESRALEEVVRERTRGLEGRPRDLLEAVARYGVINLEVHDLDAETLFLAGLLVRSERELAGSTYWRVSSPCLRDALLARWIRGGQPFRHREQLMPVRHPAMLRAYELISDLENLLRNELVLALGWDLDGDLARALLDALPEVHRDPTSEREYFDGTDRHGLLRRPVSGYLDVEALKLLVAERLRASHLAAVFPEPEPLATHLQTFTRIRRHVAHHRAVGPAMLGELSAVWEYLQHALARAAAHQLSHRVLTASLSVEAATSYPNPKRGETTVEVSVRNAGATRLAGARISCSVDGCAPVALAGVLSFEPGESRSLRFKFGTVLAQGPVVPTIRVSPP